MIRAGFFFTLLTLSSIPCYAYDFVKNSPPERWIERYLPEDLPKLDTPAYFQDLDKARDLAFHGRYKAALIAIRSIKNVPAAQTATLRATSLYALGRYTEALTALNDSTDPATQVLRAQILAQSGNLDQARVLLKTHLAKFPESIPAHFYSAQFSDTLGDMTAAQREYAWFNDDQHRFLDHWKGSPDRPPFDNAENAVLIARALDRLANLNGSYKDNHQLHEDILNMMVHAYDVTDRGYWPAHTAAARYFLAHDQTKEAGQELLAALRANPNDAETLDLLGTIALSEFDFDKADKVISALRDTDPNSFDADLLECRSLLKQRRPQDAEGLARRVIAARPKDLEAMGLLAGSLMLQLRDDEAHQILKQVESIDPGNASAYYEVADQLDSMRQYPRAAAMYKIAIERAPWWTEAQNALGLLYTQSGQEDQAHAVLDAAHAVDPYNLRTTNYLRLLDQMATFAKSETAHFRVVYNATVDPIIPEYFGEYLETIYPQVTSTFHCEPPEKTIIEVFPTHDAFSVRTTGNPWIGTVGASTGPVIAIVSPRKGPNTMGPFNWSQVLHHEFTHTVTLAATDNRIAHWMTEGLAVQQENAPIPWDWVPMLYNSVKNKSLFPLDQLTWSFIRPKRPIDRQLAYAESYWICTYIEQTWNHDAILKMLQGFKDGKSQDQVFLDSLGKSTTDFFTDFQKWTEAEVATWGYDEATSKKYAELRAQGEAMIKARQYPEAVAIWEQIAQIRPVDPLPHQRLAGLYLTKEVNEPRKAADHLVALSKVDLKDNRYAKRVARIYRDIGDLPNAMSYARRAVYVNPYDPDAHDLFAELCEKTNDTKDLAREKRVIPILAKWMEQNRKQSAISDQ
ncbi:MAG TPA: tetratricopeptide repeat protein [Tepidisphaeraceae bacterium]|jgi:tetratricopeptide (TPR) repeat protein|nr:tetratricopeptide repeat protein [Tepidisphaeraceae bacterium]